MTPAAIYAWLALHGCSIACGAGIIANLEAEVGPPLNPCTASYSGIGLSQWAGARRRRLLATLGSTWCDGPRQLDFMLVELREIGLLDELFGAADAAAAARLFMQVYVRPANRNPSRRMRRARLIATELAH